MWRKNTLPCHQTFLYVWRSLLSSAPQLHSARLHTLILAVVVIHNYTHNDTLTASHSSVTSPIVDESSSCLAAQRSALQHVIVT